MKRSKLSALPALFALACSVLAGCATTPAATQEPAARESARVQVDWTDPRQFSDVRENPASAATRNPEEWVQTLARWLQSRADSFVPSGDRLKVTFTDIRRAGTYEPWRGPQWQDVRIIKDIYPPRIDLRFTLTDAHGATVAEGERQLRDIAFLQRNVLDTTDPLRYEKNLLDDWLRKEFAATKP